MGVLSLLWLIPLLPLAGFAANGLLGRRFLSKGAVSAIACGTVLASFLISAGAVWQGLWVKRVNGSALLVPQRW